MFDWAQPKIIFGRICGIAEPKDRDAVSKVCEAMAIFSGADMIRTHDVKGGISMASVMNFKPQSKGFT